MSMKITVSELPVGGRRFAGSALLEVGTAGAHDPVRSPQPAAYGLRAVRDGAELRVRGWICAWVDAPCARCARPVELRLDRDFDVTYVAEERAKALESRELDEQELDLDYYRDDSVDIRALLAEQVHLALPMKLLCREDCQGLCPQCGIDLNEDECDCGPPVDPRLAPLAELRDRL